MINIDIESNESITSDDCIFCQDNMNSPLIEYEHTCGKYKIHQKCLDNWFLSNNISCIICRENIVNNSPSNRSISVYSPSNSSNYTYSPTNNTFNSSVNNSYNYTDIIINDPDQDDRETIKGCRKLICVFFILATIIILFITQL